LEEQLSRDGRLDWQSVARIGSEVASGLAAAHAVGVIHRDVKPGNILIEQRSGRAKLSDFGLAKSIEDTSLTQVGCVRGTPEYIAPEQAAGEQADHRADLFSLGSVLYAACTGQPPFRAGNTLAVLRRTREDQARPIREFRNDVPQALIAVIDRLLNKNPEDRFATAAEVVEALESVRQGQPIPVERTETATQRRSVRSMPVTWAASLLVLAGLAMGGIYAAGLMQTSDGDHAAVAMAKRRKKQKANHSVDAPPASADAAQGPTPAGTRELPPRVQIVTPGQLMQERIRAEKDLLQSPSHPLLDRELTGHTGPVEAVVWTPDGKQLISCSGWPSGDRTVRVWNAKNGKQVRQFDTAAMPQNPGDSGAREAPGEFFTVAVTPDGKRAVTGSTGGAVCVWDVATGKLLQQFTGHTATVYGVAVSPQGDLVLTAGREGIARLWDLATCTERMQLAGHRSWIRSVAISPDGKQALTGCYDHVMRLWDLERGEMVREIKTSYDWAWEVKFAPSGQIAAAISARCGQIWDLDSGKLLRNLTCTGAGDGTSIDISPDNRLAVTGGYDGKVRLWSVDTGELLETYTGHREWVWNVRFSPDGRQIASAGGGRFSPAGERVAGIDFAIRLWNLPSIRPRVVKP
jgi:hypothetical protein